jgi:hypothetical protein
LSIKKLKVIKEGNTNCNKEKKTINENGCRKDTWKK